MENATSGGAGGDVTVKTGTESVIRVKGKHSSGIVAQSIGGGGGNAGLTVGALVSIGEMVARVMMLEPSR